MSNFTPEQLREILSRPNYTLGHAASYPHHPSPLERVSNPEPEPDAVLSSLGPNQNEAGGKKRIVVRLERRGTKLLDVDNLYGSAKYAIDGLRAENLIPSDDPEAIDLIVTQKKVKRGETETVIEITYP
jgi:hypothetical protein